MPSPSQPNALPHVKRAAPVAVPQQRSPTGIEGLDQVLGGGLPRGHLYLVEGTPGAGKTTLGLQFLIDGRERGESCLYVTLSETANELAIARFQGKHVAEIAKKLKGA